MFSHTNGFPVNIINMAIFKQEEAERIYVAFSGTQKLLQPLYEVWDLAPVEYKLHNIPHAKVFGYFYHHYIDDFKEIMTKQLKEIMSQYPNYTVIFTGHSMGAAVSSVACLDAVLTGTIDG